MSTRNIYWSNGKYVVNKSINKKSICFGYYEKLSEAKKVREDMINHNWSKEYYITKYKPNRFISLKNGKYTIYKRINGKITHFGTYDTLEEAKKMRDMFIEYEWNVDKIMPLINGLYVLDKEKKYIHKVKGSDKYYIQKHIDGVNHHFGVYESLEEAKKERDYYESCDWDWDLIVEETI